MIFLYAVYEEVPSFRELARAFWDERFSAEIGINRLDHSSFSRRLKQMDTAVLIEIFGALVSMIQQKQPVNKRNSLYLVDSTTIPLNQNLFKWAKFRSTKSGIKLHLSLCYVDDASQYPEHFMITNASEHDHTQIEVLIDKSEATYIMDRGYFDYGLMDKMHHDGYFFVTRIKKNTLVSVLDQFEVREPKMKDCRIISDQHVTLGGGKNYATSRFRLVTILTKGQKLLRIVTNRFDVSAQEVAEMYQARWQIELFFKHLKQNLTIKKLFSRNEQGAINQVILTLIATLLTYLIKLELNTPSTIFIIKRAFHRFMFAPVANWFAVLEPG